MKPFKKYPVETFTARLRESLEDNGKEVELTMPKKRTIKVDGQEYYHIATVHDGKRKAMVYDYVLKDALA